MSGRSNPVEPVSSEAMPTAGNVMFADGGEVPAQTPPAPLPQFVEDPSAVLGRAAANQGLLGLLTGLGKSKILDPEKHDRILGEAKEQHAWRMAPTEEERPKTTGTRLGNAIADGDYDQAAELIHGTPLAGGASKEPLKAILGRMSQAMLTEAPNSRGFRAGADYLSSAAKGDAEIRRRVADLFAPGGMDLGADTGSHQELKDYIDEARENPLNLLDAGNHLAHYLPAHGAQISALAGRAVNYLNSLHPKSSQSAPLDKPLPIDQTKEAQYDRQLGIAQQPLLALKYAKEGKLQPHDVATLQTLYPGLSKKIIDGVTEELAKATGDKKLIPYRVQQSLSLLTGQPLRSTMAQVTMAAIQASNQPHAQAQIPAQERRRISKPTASSMEKLDRQSATPQQAREIDRISEE